MKPSELLAQVQAAALDYAKNLRRAEVEALTIELAAPLQPQGRGGKPATESQASLFDPQQKGLFPWRL